MHCRSCGADLPVDAAFCTQCGVRVELGSVLGVGTDLAPGPRRHGAVSTASDDLGRTRELPRVAPVPAAEGRSLDDGTRSRRSRSHVLAMVATFAVLTIIGTFALTRIAGSDDSPPVTAASSAATSPVSEETGDTQSSPSTSSPVPSTTPEVSPTASSSIPATARRCSTSGSDAVATAYAGTERTSCEFAAAVREAYREAGSPSGATSLRAYSPVTRKWYSLSCDGGEPVRCTTTTNAIVHLAP